MARHLCRGFLQLELQFFKLKSKLPVIQSQVSANDRPIIQKTTTKNDFLGSLEYNMIGQHNLFFIEMFIHADNLFSDYFSVTTQAEQKNENFNKTFFKVYFWLLKHSVYKYILVMSCFIFLIKKFKLKRELPYDSAILLRGIYLKEIK